MRKYVYLFAAVCIFAGAVFSATAGPGCEKHEKAFNKKIEAVALSASELEDGKVIEVGDGTLTMKQDGDAWTFTYSGKDGAEESVFTIALDGEEGEPQVVKIVTTSDGSDTWTSVTTGEETEIGGHHAIFISDDAHTGKDCHIVTSGDNDVICKQFETVHCGLAYTCSECGLVISVPKEKDKGAYICPNDGTEMTKSDRTKEIKKRYAYKVVTDTDEEKEVEVEVE